MPRRWDIPEQKLNCKISKRSVDSFSIGHVTIFIVLGEAQSCQSDCELEISEKIPTHVKLTSDRLKKHRRGDCRSAPNGFSYGVSVDYPGTLLDHSQSFFDPPGALKQRNIRWTQEDRAGKDAFGYSQQSWTSLELSLA